MTRRAHCLVLLLMSSCRFNDAVPLGVDVNCSSTQDCPAGATCDLTLGRCATARSGIQAELTITPQVGRPGTTFVAQLDATLAQGLVSLRVARPDGFGVGVFNPETADRFTFVAPDDVPEGRLLVLLDGLVAGEELRSTAVGELSIDRTAPVAATAVLTLSSADDNALANLGYAFLIDRVTVGTSVHLTAAVSEPLATPPALSVDCGGLPAPQLALSVSSTNPTLRLDGTLVGSPPAEGACSVMVTLVDAVGNSATQSLTFDRPLIIDTVAPPAPPVDVADRVVFTRAPNGDGPDAGPTFYVDVEVASLAEPGALVVSNTDGVAVSRAIVAALDGGARRLRLSSLRDPVDALVQLVDFAGNASPSVLVRDQLYLASLAPTLARGTEVFSPRSLLAPLDYNDQASTAVFAGFAVPGDAGTLVVTRQANMAAGQYLSGSTIIPNRTGSMLNPWLSLVFGGRAPDGTLLNDLYATDYFSVRGRLVDAGSPPAPRERGALSAARLANSSTANVLFGGLGANGPLNDTWLLETSSYPPAGSWTPVDAGPGSPPARWQHAMLLVNNSDTWLVGGRGPDGGLLGDVWRYRLGTWSQLPYVLPGRTEPALMEVSGAQLLVAGGGLQDGGLATEAWLLSPDAATPIAPLPEGRRDPVILTTYGNVLTYGHGTVEPDGGMRSLIYSTAQNLWTWSTAYPTRPYPLSYTSFYDDVGGIGSSVALSGNPIFAAYSVACNEGCSFESDCANLTGSRFEPIALDYAYPMTGLPLARGPGGIFGVSVTGGYSFNPTLTSWFTVSEQGTRVTRVEVDAGPTSNPLGLGYDPVRREFVMTMPSPYSYDTWVQPLDAGWAHQQVFINPGQPPVLVSRATESPLLVGAGVLERQADGGWVQWLDAGFISPRCATWDETHHRLYALDNPYPYKLRVWEPDGGLRSVDPLLSSGVTCPIAFSDELHHPMTVGTRLTDIDSVSARATATFTYQATVAGQPDASVVDVSAVVWAGASGVDPAGQPVNGFELRLGADVVESSAPLGSPTQLALGPWRPDGGFALQLPVTVTLQSLGRNGDGVSQLQTTGGAMRFRLRR